MILPPGGPHPARATAILVPGALKRRDTFPSCQETYEWLKGRKSSFGKWDDRVLQAFVDDGFRESKEGVILKCPKALEAASYRDQAGIIHIYHMLRSLVLSVPVHIIYGEIDDLLYVSPLLFFFCTHLTKDCDYSPREVKDHIANEASGGADKLASLQRVPGSGHLIVQTHPTALARALCNSFLHLKNTESNGSLPMPSLVDGVPAEVPQPKL